ncbi:hypothetical protein M433DRAFT_162744 [Acidomyces richmondensis BFW]|nr:MAG: hypothetical protein FE78DRAFT_42870 [Acidomyces sp. 'richmondensis']KYG49265.1 hypothetical protein M433DRAFT_162744 [Acidomyces richmondensis BFW]
MHRGSAIPSCPIAGRVPWSKLTGPEYPIWPAILSILVHACEMAALRLRLNCSSAVLTSIKRRWPGRAPGRLDPKLVLVKNQNTRHHLDRARPLFDPKTAPKRAVLGRMVGWSDGRTVGLSDCQNVGMPDGRVVGLSDMDTGYALGLRHAVHVSLDLFLRPISSRM